MMEFVEEKDNGFVLRNSDFEIVLNQRGFVEKWSVKGFSENILSEPSFVLSVGGDLDEPYVNPLSSVVSFEVDTDFGEIKRVFTVKKRAVVIDDVLISKDKCNVDYSLMFSFKGFDYFMVGKDRFDAESRVKTKANDLLLVNEKSDIYIGFIFKEKMDLVFENKLSFAFKLSKSVELGFSDMFLFSFTFSRV